MIANRDDLVADYLQALQIELSWLEQPRPVTSLFVGGGTPSHLPPSQLQRLLELLNQWFPAAEDREFSVEANPIDLNRDQVGILADAGVNRVSLGAQSFDAAKLSCLERDHDGDMIRQAAAVLQERVANVALDLIFAAPQEKLAAWSRDLQQAIALRPAHISTYGLTFEKGTSFWARQRRAELAAIDEDRELAMYELAINTLTASGFEHYEVSNFARPGRRCRHNQVYWTGGEFFAAGPGAARLVDGRREVNHRSTTTYLKRVLAGMSPVAELELLPPIERARERLVFGLRLLDGVDVAELAGEFDLTPLELNADIINRFLGAGYLQRSGNVIRLTRRGLFISDSLWPELLS